MTEVSAQVTVILSYRSVPTGPRSRCIPPRSRSPSICSLCSRDPHSFPSRASTVQPGRGLVTLDCSRREVCVNVSLSLIPHLFFQSSRLVIVRGSLSFFIPSTCLSLLPPRSVCVSHRLCALLLTLCNFQAILHVCPLVRVPNQHLPGAKWQ